MKLRSGIGIGLTAAVLAVAGVAAWGLDLSSAAPASATRLPPATGTVTRMTLTETEKVSGTLRYGEARLVTGRATGTITWLPAEGSIVDRGAAVYRRDERPVPLLLGALPLYRTLSSGLSGADVRQLEDNLAALGYAGFTVDDEFTGSTDTAVRSWQSDLGLPTTGSVDANQVVITAGPIRISEVKAAVGDPANGALLTYTGTTREIDIALDVAQQHLVKEGLAATVTLPDGSTVEGKVATVGTVATTSGGGTGQAPSTTIAVVVSISDQAKLGTLDSAPVSVALVADRRENVLTVPIAALVALVEGGYGLEVVTGSSSQFVAVTTGLFANGRVEVTGDGIAEGTVVGLPA